MDSVCTCEVRSSGVWAILSSSCGLGKFPVRYSAGAVSSAVESWFDDLDVTAVVSSYVTH